MANKPSHYADAGVDIDAGQKTVNLMKSAIQATYTSAVLSDTGNFGGLFAADAITALDKPILVASTDGVGTKTKVASRMNRWDGIGQDLVNHCINDILVQGASPLFFLDYVASSALVPEQIATIVTGMAEACKMAGCALLGGETAEMPGVYEPGEVDVVGTIIGVVDQKNLLDGSRIQEGDVLFGVSSTGLHTNGFSLARKVLAEQNWEAPNDTLGASIGQALLAPHRSYLSHIHDLRDAGIPIHGLAHITGGGIIDNVPRILPEGLCAVINRGTWPVLPIFSMIQELGQIDPEEMYRVFNMGIGMVVILPAEHKQAAQEILAEDAYIIGHVEIDSGSNPVQFRG